MIIYYIETDIFSIVDCSSATLTGIIILWQKGNQLWNLCSQTLFRAAVRDAKLHCRYYKDADRLSYSQVETMIFGAKQPALFYYIGK